MPEQVLEITPTLTIPEHLAGEVCSKLAYVDELVTGAEIDPTGERLYLSLRHPANTEERLAIAEKTQRVVTLMVKGAIQPKVVILEDHLDRSVPYQADPISELLARGEVHPEATGIYALGPLVTRLMDYFEGRFLELAGNFKANPHRFPTLIPASYLSRVNYFRAFPHSLTFVTHLREDLDVIDHFAAHADCDEHGQLITPPDSFAAIETLLSPAVCYHLYFSLADKPLPGGRVVATAVGNCFRYESTNLTSLERLWNFTMREVIFVGDKDFVLDNREASRGYMQTIFEEIGLAYRVESANDPFFIGEFRKQAAFQSAFQLKYEIQARLPFKDSTLAVGSYNYHQDFFGRNLNITLPDGSPAHTGCTAFGLERMAFAFLAQYGLDPQSWPIPVRSVIGSNSHE
jgi:seryl-tRNA synthetase